MGILRLEIDGLWYAEDLASLMRDLDQAYVAFGALNWLATGPKASETAAQWGSGAPTARQALQATMSFHLGTGLSISTMHYGSAGTLDFLGDWSIVKQIRKAITDWRATSAWKEKARQEDRRENIKEEHRHRERKREFQLEDLQARRKFLLELIDRLPPEQQGATVAEILELGTGTVVAIASNAGVRDVKALPSEEGAA